jgi:hypothetical protein
MGLARNTLQEALFSKGMRDEHLAYQRDWYAGDCDRAIEWRKKAYEVHHPGMPYISFNPSYDPLRFDPRFQDLLRPMNTSGSCAISPSRGCSSNHAPLHLAFPHFR